MSVFMMNLYQPEASDPFHLKYYYNIFVCGYQFLMFLAKLSIFLFIVRQIKFYTIVQMVFCVFVGTFIMFCKRLSQRVT